MYKLIDFPVGLGYLDSGSQMQDRTNVLGSMFCVWLSNVQPFAGVFFNCPFEYSA